MAKAIFTLLALMAFGTIKSIKLEPKYLWKEVDFAWPSEQVKNQALDSGSYVVANNLPLGLDIWRDKLFITVPR